MYLNTAQPLIASLKKALSTVQCTMLYVQLRQTDSFVRHPSRAFELLLCNAIDSSPCFKIFVTQQPYSTKPFITKLTPSFSWFYSLYLRLNYIQNCGEKFWLRHLWSNIIICSGKLLLLLIQGELSWICLEDVRYYLQASWAYSD